MKKESTSKSAFKPRIIKPELPSQELIDLVLRGKVLRFGGFRSPIC